MCTRTMAQLSSIHVPCVLASCGVNNMCNCCSGLQNAAEYRQIKNWACSSCSSPPMPHLLPSPLTTKTPDDNPFTIVQFNANGIGDIQVELGEFIELHKVKVAVIQDSMPLPVYQLMVCWNVTLIACLPCMLNAQRSHAINSSPFIVCMN